jgi:hypothetical protein
MALKGRVRRLERETQSEGVILRLRDGGLRIIDRMEIAKEMFLSQMDLMLSKARPLRSWAPCKRPRSRVGPSSSKSKGASRWSATSLQPTTRSARISLRRGFGSRKTEDNYVI